VVEQFRRIATRYDKLGATFFAFIKIAAVRGTMDEVSSHVRLDLPFV
jgi:hypothetical protein